MHDLLDSPEKAAKYNAQRFYSDKLIWFLIGLFVIGLVFKNRHWPGAGLMLVAVGGFSGLFLLAQLAEGIKFKNPLKMSYGIAFAFSMIYFVFRFQYWPGAIFLLALAGISALVPTIYLGIKKRQNEFNRKALWAVSLAIFLSTFPNSSVFYHTNMSKTLNPWEHEHACFAWQRYGDMLRAEGKNKEADAANSKWLECLIKEGSNEF
jgi:peptidoglycan/LPS O-acetylase OafA/YrhL